MADKTSIEWTERTWNPVRGCSRTSPGCVHCYAEVMATRFSGQIGTTPEGEPVMGWGHGFAERTPAGGRWTGEVALIPEKLAEPLSWRKPARCFVNSTSDLFHERLSNEEIAAVFGIMAAVPRVTFQILTKRAERMAEWFEWITSPARWPHRESDPIGIAYCSAVEIFEGLRTDADRTRWAEEGSSTKGAQAMDAAGRALRDLPWPLPNVHLGVSVESQQYAERIKYLLRCPAAVRFVSYEPALGPVDFRPYLVGEEENGVDLSRGIGAAGACVNYRPALDWIIVGGESGPGARPFDIVWARSVVEQCREAGVACFVKQLGSAPRGICSWGSHDEFPAKWLDEDGVLPSISGKKPHDLCHAAGDNHWPCAPKLKDRQGGDMDEWPEDLRVREFPEVARG